MGIPIISEIWDGIRWMINFFIDKTPKPIKIIIFLLSLIFLGSIISTMLHFSGFHCTSNKELVKIDTTDIMTNVRIWYIQSRDSISGEEVSIKTALPNYDNIETLISCFLYLKNDSGDFKSCEDEDNETGCRYYMTEPDCHNCEILDVGVVFTGNFHFSVCKDYAYYKTDYTTWEKLWCQPNCDIPYGYMYDPFNARFECVNDTICGDNITTNIQILTEVDAIIDNSNFELVTKSDKDEDYTNFVNIKCNNNHNPRLAFFNLDLLDFKIWLIIIVIYIMFMFLSHIKKH